MALKAILESIDDLDASIAAEYEEKDGKFYLSIDGVESHPKVINLKTALERQKAEKAAKVAELVALQTKIKDYPEEFTLEEWHRLQALDDGDDEGDAGKKKAKQDERLAQAKRNYEQQITNLQNKYNTDIAAANEATAQERKLRAGDRAETELSEAMDRAKIDPKFRPAVKALHRDKLKHEIEEDGSIRFFVETDLGQADLISYLETWANSDDGKIYVAAPSGPSGKNTQGGGGSGTNNPFAAESWNKTSQAQLRTTDAVKAERQARAAGFGTLDEALKATRAIAKA